MDTRAAFEAWAKLNGVTSTGVAFKAYQAGRLAGFAEAREMAAKVADGAIRCCENYTTGGEYMGSVETICCGEPITEDVFDLAEHIRALEPKQ